MKLKTKLKKLSMIIMIATAGTVLLAGCGGQDKKTFTIAYAPNESTEQSADARKGLAKDLSKEMGVEVKEIQASDYNAIIEALRTKKADMAYLGPLALAMGYDRAKIEPIVMKAVDGDRAKATYKSMLITRADNVSINSIQDIKGKTMAFVDPESTSGHLIPIAEILRAFPNDNLRIETLHSNGKFFSAVLFSGKHQASIQAVLKGDVDVAGVSDQILEAEIKTGNVKQDQIKVIYESKLIPAEAMVVRQDMSVTEKEKLQNFLVQYNNPDYFKLVIKKENARFISSSIADYEDVISLNKLIN